MDPYFSLDQIGAPRAAHKRAGSREPPPSAGFLVSGALARLTHIQENSMTAIRGRVPARTLQHENAPGSEVPAHVFDPEALERVRRRARRDASTGCAIWTGKLTSHGYGRVGYLSKVWFAHRLAYYGHHGPIPKDRYVCHKCDTPSCVAIEHLFAGTPQDNTTDMMRKGRGRWRTRLTAKQVVAIKGQLLRGESLGAIAREYGMSHTAIIAIKHGKSWAHIRIAGERPRSPRSPYDDRIPILEFRTAE
jgi:hypothetical protein